MKRSNILVALKGFFMGAANVVPGVSGGTIALITGIYTEIIESLNALLKTDTWGSFFHGRFKEFWQKIHGGFLVALLIGVLLSVFSLAKLMKYVLANHPIQTWAFFFGLILASAVLMIKDIKGWGIKEIIFTIIGIALGITVCTLTPTQTPDTWWFLLICGAIAMCTMILPGISGSFILLILGKYEPLMTAISELQWGNLGLFAVGSIAGLLAFSKFLHWLLGKYEKQTMLVLLGFVLGSLIKVWPWADKTTIAISQGIDVTVPENLASIDPMIGSAVLWCFIGIAIVAAIEIAGKKVGDKQKN